MVMWRVTISPKEDRNAWETCKQQGIIVIGWPNRAWDDEPPVRRFREIAVGDWAVAHVPEDYGGGDCLAMGVGRVVGGYHEVQRSDLREGDGWIGDFRRQYRVNWTLGPASLRGVTSQYRGTVQKLRDDQEQEILEIYGLSDGRAPAGPSNLEPASVRPKRSRGAVSFVPEGAQRVTVNGNAGVALSSDETAKGKKWVVILSGENEPRSFYSPPARVEEAPPKVSP